MELMEKLQYDFDTNPQHDVSLNDSMSKSSTSLPSLEHENSHKHSHCAHCRAKQTKIELLSQQNVAMKGQMDALNRQLRESQSKVMELTNALEAIKRQQIAGMAGIGGIGGIGGMAMQQK